MKSIKVVIATGAVVASTVGGAYATGVVNKNGHEVNDHAAHGQAVAAAARAKHLATDPGTTTPSVDPSETATPDPSETPSETPSVDPTETATAEPSETTEPTETATTEPTESETAEPATPEAKHAGWTTGQHKGWTKGGKHYGVGHGTGEPVKPEHTTAPKAENVPDEDALTTGEAR
jgi:hypothetical protein